MVTVTTRAERQLRRRHRTAAEARSAWTLVALVSVVCTVPRLIVVTQMEVALGAGDGVAAFVMYGMLALFLAALAPMVVAFAAGPSWPRERAPTGPRCRHLADHPE